MQLPAEQLDSGGDAILSAAMQASGDWLPQSVVLALLGSSYNVLGKARRNGKVRAVPSMRGKNGQGHSFWYFRDDVERLAAQKLSRPEGAAVSGVGDGIMRELELAMANAEAHAQELGRVRAEAELERLRAQSNVERLERELEAERRRGMALEDRVNVLADMLSSSVQAMKIL